MKMMGILEKSLFLWMSPPWFRGSEGGHHILHVSCNMAETNSRTPSEGTGRDNGGLNKHLGQMLLGEWYPRWE